MSHQGHASAEAIELYSLGRMVEPELSLFEEHLLVCPQCQALLEEEDRFTEAARGALARLEQSPLPQSSSAWWSSAFRWPNLAWAGGLAAAAVLVLMFAAGPQQEQRIELYAQRGAEIATSTPVRAGTPVRLVMSTAELPSSASYLVEVVDGSGRLIWQGTPSSSAGKLEIAPGELAPGTYWIRLYEAGAEKRQLREFAVRAT